MEGTDLKKTGEFGLIRKIRGMSGVPAGMTGIGDDCAVIPQKEGLDTLVSTDMLVEKVHFLMDDITPWQLGWKSAAVNISDIAAMGGIPTGSFLSFALPRTLPEGWIDAFLEGYAEISSEYGVPLLGGDTTSSEDGLCISVTVLGACPSGQAKKRNAAKAGDLVCVTGCLGDSAGGLKAVIEGAERDDETVSYLIGKHYLPRPRVREGQALSACPGVHAMMDVSDGIGSDLRHILDESGAGAVVDVNSIPVSGELRAFCKARGSDPLDCAICGGEDYELLFTVSPDAAVPVPCHVIGRIVPGSGIEWKGADKDYMGFRHF